MKDTLVVIDMQNDFIDGVLGTPEAVAIVKNVINKIKTFDGRIIATQDTHNADNYLQSSQGSKLPVLHCIEHSNGWMYNEEVFEAFKYVGGVVKLKKSQFASTMLIHMLYSSMGRYDEEFNIEFIGLCTDICVLSNAIMIKSIFPNANVTVDASCCAGSSPKRHIEALNIMRSCNINIINYHGDDDNEPDRVIKNDCDNNTVIESENIDDSGSKKIFIVNGMAGCGKDTFANIMDTIISTHKCSSIDIIKSIASMCGWDGTKTEKSRKFLSDLKILTTEYCDLSFNGIRDNVKDFLNHSSCGILLIDIREPEDIERAKKEFGAESIIIHNDRVTNITSNPADANVFNYTYDYTLYNNGSLDEFHDEIKSFVKTLCQNNTSLKEYLRKDL